MRKKTVNVSFMWHQHLFFSVFLPIESRKEKIRPTDEKQTDRSGSQSFPSSVYERMKNQWMNHQLSDMTVFFFQNPNPRSGPTIVYMVTALVYNNHRLLSYYGDNPTVVFFVLVKTSGQQRWLIGPPRNDGASWFRKDPWRANTTGDSGTPTQVPIHCERSNGVAKEGMIKMRLVPSFSFEF